ncbi:putative cell wall binding repeat protein [compost metagenome]
MKTGWLMYNGKWYYLKNDGSMSTGWSYIDNNWYYLYNDGSMAYDTNIEGYKLDKYGIWIK